MTLKLIDKEQQFIEAPMVLKLRCVDTPSHDIRSLIDFNLITKDYEDFSEIKYRYEKAPWCL